jgi:carboxymethylenebutenolidase
MREHEDALGFRAWPEGAPVPGVVMIPDVWGLADHTRGLARRLAGEGFAVLAIDPYRKTGAPRLTDVASALAWIRELSDPLVLETIQEAVDALAAHAAVAGRRVGVTGFCMGGQYALLAACGCRGLSACAPFYGMLRYAEGLDPQKKPRSPLEALADLSCPVLGLYGAEDAIIPLADVRELEERLAKSGRSAEVRIYPGAGHAFLNDTRPELYRPAAAADAWPRLVTFLRGCLVEGRSCGFF